MKNDKIKNILIIVGVVVFCVLFAGAMLMYDKLSGDFSQIAPEKDGADTQVVLADDFRVYDSDGNAVRLSDKIGKPVVVNFWATWCGPCRMIAPIVEEIAAENVGKIKVGKVNVDEQEELAVMFSISAIPTLVVIKDGEVVNKIVGIKPKEDILKLFE